VDEVTLDLERCIVLQLRQCVGRRCLVGQMMVRKGVRRVCAGVRNSDGDVMFSLASADSTPVMLPFSAAIRIRRVWHRVRPPDLKSLPTSSPLLGTGGRLRG